MSEEKKDVTLESIYELSTSLGIDWSQLDYDVLDLHKGILVEFEHGTINPETNITNDDLVLTAKIALAHLNESDKYYDYLEKMEKSF